MVVVASFLIVSVSTNAQSDKKEPPPPPPKPKEEKVKFTPPKIVKDEETKFTPAKIVRDGEAEKPPVIKVSGKMADEFYKKNPSVSDISRKGNVITLKMKDGTTEEYDMSKKEDDKSFTDKYGTSPIPPPPPPKKKVKA